MYLGTVLGTSFILVEIHFVKHGVCVSLLPQYLGGIVTGESLLKVV